MLPSNDFPNYKEAGEFLAGELERLMRLPLDTPEDDRRWNLDATEVKAAMDTQHPRFVMEQQAVNFLADAEIFRRDAAYRQAQYQCITGYVARLRGHDDAT
jgi:hypothetical protein